MSQSTQMVNADKKHERIFSLAYCETLTGNGSIFHLIKAYCHK